MSPLQHIEIHFSIASLYNSLLEVPSDMFNPLALPVTVDLHGSEDSTLLEMKQLLLAESGDMSLLPLFFLMFDISFQHYEA